MERDPNALRLPIGSKAPYFSLKGTDGKIHSLPDFTSARALLVLFTCNHCPYAQAYESRLIELARIYQPRGVKFVAICSNDPLGYPEDDFDHMVEKSRVLKLPFPYLHDDTQAVAEAYDAQCTPEAYLFDSELKLFYQGRIDDNHRDPSQVTSHDLSDALDAVLSDEPLANNLTPAFGCSIKWRR